MKGDQISIARAMPAAERVIAVLKNVVPVYAGWNAAESLRRFEETIGDIDLVCTATHPQQVLDALASLPNVTQGGGPWEHNNLGGA